MHRSKAPLYSITSWAEPTCTMAAASPGRWRVCQGPRYGPTATRKQEGCRGAGWHKTIA